MQKITVNGITFLGKKQETEDGKIILTKSMRIDGSDYIHRSIIAEYLKRKNLKELNTETFSGMGTSVSECDLTDEEKLDFKICKQTMKLAQKKAVDGLANNLFDKYLGKM